MKPIAKIVCGSIILVWAHGACASEITIRESGGSIILESNRTAVTQASAPAAAPPTSSRVTVQPYVDTVDRTKIEKRLEDRGIRTRQRALEAEKDAAARAAQQ